MGHLGSISSSGRSQKMFKSTLLILAVLSYARAVPADGGDVDVKVSVMVNGEEQQWPPPRCPPFCRQWPPPHCPPFCKKCNWCDIPENSFKQGICCKLCCKGNGPRDWVNA